MAASDYFTLAGVPDRAADARVQAPQTSRAKVQYNMGVARNRDAEDQGAAVRRIGGINLQNHDPRLNIYKGDVLLTDRSQRPRENIYGGLNAVDGRPTVYSSLAGYAVPAGIETKAQWQRLHQPVGFSFFDVLIQDAASTPAYGATILTGGSMALIPHIVPEEIGAGEMLIADIGPMDPVEREEWKKDFRYNGSTHTHDSEKAVLRPFNPHGGLDFLSTAFEQYFVLLNIDNDRARLLNNPTLYGRDLADPEDFGAVALARPILAAIAMGVALLNTAGWISINARPAPADFDKLFAAPSAADKKNLEHLVQAFGLDDSSLMDPVLCKSIFGAFWTPLANHTEIVEAVSLRHHFPAAMAHRLQEESGLMLIVAITNAYYENASRIIAKATENSKQGNDGLGIVIAQ